MNKHVDPSRAVDPRKDIYKPLPKTVDLVDWEAVDAVAVASNVCRQPSAAIEPGAGIAEVEQLFRAGLCHWRDTLSLTAHLRTFTGSEKIATTFRSLAIAREVSGISLTDCSALVASPSADSSWVDCSFSFETGRPRAQCQGKLAIVPEKDQRGDIQWKIWSMATFLVDWTDYPEESELLSQPSMPIRDDEILKTDVVIVGAGNAGLIQAARLKAAQVDFIVVEKNVKAGDNWGNRYEYLRFHIGKGYCQVPYLPYSEEHNYLLTRDELRDHMARFAKSFDLDKRVLYQTRISETTYVESSQSWVLRVRGKGGSKIIHCRGLVLATGTGFGKPKWPWIERQADFPGPNVHSDQFKSGQNLKELGVKSVVIVGSANAAFDVLEDCHNAGLQVTMIQRSPTLVIPMEYYEDPKGMGLFDLLPTHVADVMFSTSALHVGGELSRIGHATRAEAEPHRYIAAQETGLRIKDCTEDDLLTNLLSNAGGFIVDMGTGGMDLIASGAVKVVPGSPVAYCENGLRISNGSEVHGDAIVWCIGYEKDVVMEVQSVLGAGWETIAPRLEPTMGVDAEGEVRGMWKRHVELNSLWILGGGTAQHRWYSKMIALQVKGMLEGMLPEAYRE